jgi:hypothetical protein
MNLILRLLATAQDEGKSAKTEEGCGGGLRNGGYRSVDQKIVDTGVVASLTNSKIITSLDL